ncbi:DEAD/DEAH box helicase [Pseudokineococcus lusitanus]|uniref:ATP-dependent RNA helicase HelY n=1 Tax=Pseudokineococcus lusitanus TaxID=763993 RepID=A0A3N1HSN2_9ACTN|nr:DEAD/DEAH box helicase [Pseudokineococcus lusitanus]ROP45525.1 ATP-dependent RNA helicase HelY [Pseudokineococcus lusitanus]
MPSRRNRRGGAAPERGPDLDPEVDVVDPAARFAAARARAQAAKEGRLAEGVTELERFRASLPFRLDDFQVRACRALEEGRGVLVAAPTGAGKTVVGEFAVHLALARGRKAFYTAPIKALSNQKHAELVERHGADRVGLLTGDVVVNGDAPVVVMTTEVLRNMLYAGSPALAGLGYVVMDEVHYLADRFRGPVWEEVILHLPQDVRIASLSATVSNAEEFGAWLDTVRGGTEVVVSEVRPVPLWQHVLTGRDGLVDLFVGEADQAVAGGSVEQADGDARPQVNPELTALARDEQRGGRTTGSPPPRGGRRRRGGYPPHRPKHAGGGGADARPSQRPPSRAHVVAALDDADLLPAITFVFSRNGCDAAVRQCMAAGLRLTTPEDRLEIRAVVEAACADIPDTDLAVLGYWEWLEGLQRGVAAHHAGLLPRFKEVVEELFSRGLVKAVFATETLALGINMPARSVVLEKLVKYDGEKHADITPGEYTQLTGRAGRRGIDVEGHAVVLWQPGIDPEHVAGLASRRLYPLRSRFRPTSNMAVNLVGGVGRGRAREILETSFAQFQADRAVVGLARRARTQEEALDGYAEAMACHLGDFAEYAALRRRISELEKEGSREATRRRRAEVLSSLEGLQVGDVVRVPGGRRAGTAVVLDPGADAGLEGPRPTVLTEDREVRRLQLQDVAGAVEVLARVRVRRDFNARDAGARRDLAGAARAALAEADPPARQRGRRRDDGRGGDAVETVEALRRELRRHPCHGCPDREQHARWAERWSRLRQETDGLVQRIEGRTSGIARVFDKVCDLLLELGYLAPVPVDEAAAEPDGRRAVDEVAVTPAGRRLGRVYAEKDLLVAQCLREDVLAGLDGPGVAAVASALVFEARREEVGTGPRTPSGVVGEALRAVVGLWSDLEERERAHGLTPTSAPDVGLALPMQRWARGASLQEVLDEAAGLELGAGDFVRWCKQTVDLLDQLAGAAGDDPRGREVRAAALDAVDRVRRGVVAYSVVT